MAAIILPNRLRRQPQHSSGLSIRELSVPLRVAYLPHVLAPFDLSRNAFHATGVTSVTNGVGAVGRTWDFGGVSNNRISLPSGALTLGPSTFLAVVNVASLSSQRAICSTNFGGTGGAPLQWFINTSGFQGLTVPGVAVLATDSGAGNAVAANTWVTLAAKTTGSNPPAVTFFRDGRLTSFVSNGSPAAPSGTATPCIGERVSGNNNPFHGKIALFAQFDGLLPDAECCELTANPYQLFQAPARRIWVGAAVGSHTLDGASCEQANASGAGAIVQTHALSGAACSQENASGTGAGSQVHVLAGSPASQPNAAGTAAVSQVHVLVGTASVQDNAASVEAVVQVHVLVGSANVQESTSGTGAGAQVHLLAGAPCSEASISGTGAVSQAHILSGAGSGQGNASAAEGVEQVHVLGGSASTQENLASVGGIDGAVQLAGAPSSQANAAAVGQVLQVHLLAGGAANQENTGSVAAVLQAHLLAGASSWQLNVSSAGALYLSDALRPNLANTINVVPGVRHLVARDRVRSIDIVPRIRHYVTRTPNMIYNMSPKRSVEAPVLSLNIARELAAVGDNILAVTSKIKLKTGVAHDDMNSMLVGAAGFEGTKIFQCVGGGLSGNVYYVRLYVTTQSSQILEFVMELAVDDEGVVFN